jgi:hypothetical protein
MTWMTGRTSPGGSVPGTQLPGSGSGSGSGSRTADGDGARDEHAVPDRRTRLLAWSAALAIGAAILVMIGVSAAGPSAAVATTPRPAAGPPWWLTIRLGSGLVTGVLWAAAAVGGGGVVAGLAAVAGGARPPARLLLAGALVAVAALTVLPPAGSTDALSYAIDGRIVATGHSPYVMTPEQLRSTGDPVARLAPPAWVNDLSIYGPLATAEEWGAAELGGTSAARITFWLKLWNALAFGAVVLALDRLLRGDPARRVRAHLLWSVNPLLLWSVVAGGHVDGLATALGFGGLLVLRVRQPGGTVNPARAFTAGLLVGAATACKITFGLFGLSVLWASRKSLPALAGALAGFLVVLAPGYALVGWPAVKALAARTQGGTTDNFYQLIYPPWRHMVSATSAPAGLMIAAAALVACLAALTLRRLPAPAGFTELPAVRPALALSLTWLFAWPFQRPWYDVMIVCLLALYQASRLDWVVLVRLLAGSSVYILARDDLLTPHWVNSLFLGNVDWLAPAINLAAVTALAWLCLSGSWRRRHGPTVPPAR